MILKHASRFRKTQCVCWGNVLEKDSLEDQDTDTKIILSLAVEMLDVGRGRELNDGYAPWRPSY